jgi:hypothetical protein
MTQDDIIQMARQAGMYGLVEGGLIEEFEAFAKLVAAREREACAKVCDQLVNEENSEDYRNAANWCSLRIRVRGEQA